MELKDYLNSINFSKVNVIRESSSSEAAEKLYLPFVVSRSLSYFPECIFYTNLLNLCHGVDNIQHYEFLLHCIPKGKRFSKWGKAEKDEEAVACMMKQYGYSRKKAKEAILLLTDEQKKELVNSYKID